MTGAVTTTPSRYVWRIRVQLSLRRISVIWSALFIICNSCVESRDSGQISRCKFLGHLIIAIRFEQTFFKVIMGFSLGSWQDKWRGSLCNVTSSLIEGNHNNCWNGSLRVTCRLYKIHLAGLFPVKVKQLKWQMFYIYWVTHLQRLLSIETWNIVYIIMYVSKHTS